jgi:hypothetical protein
VNVFRFFHRSIVDASLLKEVSQWPLRRVGGYLLRIFLLSALAISCARVYRMYDGTNGLAAHCTVIFEGCGVDNGVLTASRAMPYPVDAYAATEVFYQLFGPGGPHYALPDSFAVIDTQARDVPRQSGIRVLITSRNLLLNSGMFPPVRIPYSALLPASGRFALDRNVIDRGIKRLIVPLCLAVALQEFVFNFFLVVLTVLFLAGMSYALSLPRLLGFGRYFKMACACCTPMIAGDALIALSGAQMAWPAYLFFCISVFILLRGIKAAAQQSNERGA